jgi:hypothetical protein
MPILASVQRKAVAVGHGVVPSPQRVVGRILPAEAGVGIVQAANAGDEVAILGPVSASRCDDDEQAENQGFGR